VPFVSYRDLVRTLSATFGVMSAGHRLMVAERGYVHSELLAEPGWLRERRNDQLLSILDGTSLEKYERAHIPEAVGLPVHPWIKAPEGGVHVMDVEAFAEVFGRLGVAAGT